jgi:hypothetical protein
MTHWNRSELLRPVCEAPFYILWALGPQDAGRRRQRAFAVWIMTRKTKWPDSLRDARLGPEATTGRERPYADGPERLL